MALTSTLFTGLSGLNVNQTRLNVVGHNIANVNTVAYKGSRAIFKPQFYVTDMAGSPPTGDFGGTNPSQRGLGAVVAAIQKDFTPGPIEATGRSTDLAIDGDGFFVVQSTERRFTRDGSFTLNAANELVTTGGDYVMGYGVDADYQVVVGVLQRISIPMGSTTSAKQTRMAELKGNLNSSGPVASGASVVASQLLTTFGGAGAPTDATLLTDLVSSDDPATRLMPVDTTYTLAGSKGGRALPESAFTVTAASTVADLNAFMQQAMGIDTSVPAGAAPTPGVGLQTDATDPTAARLVLTGNAGNDNALELNAGAFSAPGAGSPFAFAQAAQSAPSGESVHTSFVAYDSLGTPLTLDLTAVLESTSDVGNTWRFFVQSRDDTDVDLVVGNGTLTFDNTGQLASSTGTTISLDRSDTGAATPMSVELDFGGMTSLTSNTSQMVMTRQDGSPIGTLSSFTIGANGIVTGAFSNGLTRTLGQVAVATFSNPAGLEDHGGNMFVPGSNSGEPIIAAPMEMGAGAVQSGALEMSNVDLAEEFINLIVASTGFTAASRVISSSEQLLTELLNTSR